MREAFLSSVLGRVGHFQLESGHHTDYWMDLESLCLRPSRMRPFVRELAAKLTRYEPELVCGPLTEGAFVGLLVAAELNIEFTYAERIAPPLAQKMYPVEYRLPKMLRPVARGSRVAIVNDVISAGSAVRGTLNDLHRLGAKVVSIGALLVLGGEFRSFAAESNLPVEALADNRFNMWLPADCPLCRAGSPVELPG